MRNIKTRMAWRSRIYRCKFRSKYSYAEIKSI